jgi:hypothetical protein
MSDTKPSGCPAAQPAIPGVQENQIATVPEVIRDASAQTRELLELRAATRLAIVQNAQCDLPFLLSNLAATIIATAGLLADPDGADQRHRTGPGRLRQSEELQAERELEREARLVLDVFVVDREDLECELAAQPL